MNSVTLFHFVFMTASSNRYFCSSEAGTTDKKREKEELLQMIHDSKYDIVVIVVVAHFTFVFTLVAVMTHSSFALSYEKNSSVCFLASILYFDFSALSLV